MKNFLFFIVIGMLISCSKDEEKTPTCEIADFLGVWNISGGSACILTDTNVLTITDGGSGKINGVYTGGGVTSEFDLWTVDNCNFTGSIVDTDFGINIAITGTLSDGKLKIENKGTVFGLPVNCTENLTK